MNSWSDRTYEAVGHGRSSPDTDFDYHEFYFGGLVPKGENWKFQIKCHSLDRNVRRGRGSYQASVIVFYFPATDAYLVDGSVTFANDGIERKNFTVGQIDANPNRPEWSKVFSVNNVRLSCVPEGVEPVTVRVRYRVRQSYDCKCVACDACQARKAATLLAESWAKSQAEKTKSPLQQPVPMPKPNPVPKPLQSLVADFQKLLFSPVSSDVVFKIGDESVPAHQLILTTRVPYFERLFASGMIEANSKVITIEDADVISFKELLKFIYSGELPMFLSDSPEQYLLMAEKYDIQDLKSCCCEALEKKLASDNAVEILILAHLCHCSALKEECFRRLKEWKANLPKEAFDPLKAHSDLMLEFIQAT